MSSGLTPLCLMGFWGGPAESQVSPHAHRQAHERPGRFGVAMNLAGLTGLELPAAPGTGYPILTPLLLIQGSRTAWHEFTR